MKFNFNKSMLLLSVMLVSGKLMAQSDSSSRAEYVQPFSSSDSFRTWSIGIEGGLLTPYTIFRGYDDYDSPHSKLGYGGYIKKQFMHSFGAQLNFFRGTVAGAGPAPGPQTAIRDAFHTHLKYAVDLSGDFTLANISYNHHRNFVQPYFSAGFGLMGFQPKLYSSAGTETPYGNKNIKAAYIPVGLGLKLNLSPMVNLDLGYQVNFVDGDNFDGYNAGTRNDKFSYAHAGLEFALGSRSKPQLATHNPVNSIRIEYLTKEQALQQQLEEERAKNERLRSDLNSTNANLSALSASVAKLTTDSDGDGVLDINDKCPNTPAGTKVDGSGCPLPTPTTKVYVTEEDRRVVREAIKNLEFEFGKATIKPRSFPSLDRVANILVNKNFSLKLAGHTDNVGSNDANLKLSKDRAESVKAYLVSKGANESRIEATGYGETQPIASNKTAAGRQKNRRVEFTLF